MRGAPEKLALLEGPTGERAAPRARSARVVGEELEGEEGDQQPKMRGARVKVVST